MFNIRNIIIYLYIINCAPRLLLCLVDEKFSIPVGCYRNIKFRSKSNLYAILDHNLFCSNFHLDSFSSFWVKGDKNSNKLSHL